MITNEALLEIAVKWEKTAGLWDASFRFSRLDFLGLAREIIELAQSEAYGNAIEICTNLGESLMTSQMRNACMECAYEIKKLRDER